ncbi:SAM-dependent methyltransferase [Kitasatospora sp. HPMI-4]|uniref:SAM-dependent methyltransferase n=1 Tax=Kitasatospora sp. HPMI-4 TaxID=3448443 RepID=UPI003F1941A9
MDLSLIGVTSADKTTGGRRPANSEMLRFDVAHPSRLQNYLLGGKDHLPADRSTAEQLLVAAPGLPTAARANRRFLERAVEHLASVGIGQFVDIGSGLPAAINTHQVARRANPSASVIYVDSCPMVVSHARALNAGPHRGFVTAHRADLPASTGLLSDLAQHCGLDLDRPVAVLLVGVLHLIEDTEDATAVVRGLIDALPSGSYLALTHATADFAPEQAARTAAAFRRVGVSLRLRSQTQVAALMDGLERVEPGLQAISGWCPGKPHQARPNDAVVSCYGAMGRRP